MAYYELLHILKTPKKLLTAKTILIFWTYVHNNEVIMGRNNIRRLVQATPAVKGFSPFGRIEGRRKSITLTLDEYEALRLLDYENYTQEKAAIQMQISRPTLTRIYEQARKKIASALVEGRILYISGGEIKLKNHLFLCEDCGRYYETDELFLFHCPQCESPHIVSLEDCYQNQCRKCKKCMGGNHAKF